MARPLEGVGPWGGVDGCAGGGPFETCHWDGATLTCGPRSSAGVGSRRAGVLWLGRVVVPMWWPLLAWKVKPSGLRVMWMWWEWTRWWWKEQRVMALSALVAPRWEYQVMWWTSHQEARRVQAGHWQWRSRVVMARRWVLSKSRLVRPTSSGAEGAVMTMRVASQSHINCASTLGAKAWPSSSSAGATLGHCGSGPAVVRA